MVETFYNKVVIQTGGRCGPNTDQEFPFPLIAPCVALCSLLQMAQTPHHFPSDSCYHPEANLSLSHHTASNPSHKVSLVYHWEAPTIHTGTLYPQHHCR